MALLQEAVPEESPDKGAREPTEEDDPGVRVSQANTGQLGPESRAELLGILEEYDSKGLFPPNPKVVREVNG